MAVRITIGSGGEMRCLSPATGCEVQDALSTLGRATTRRASVVEPVALWRRVAFRLLRWAFGDRGRVAAWTRRWRGQWRVQVLDGPSLGTHDTREQAIRAEEAWFAGRQL